LWVFFFFFFFSFFFFFFFFWLFGPVFFFFFFLKDQSGWQWLLLKDSRALFWSLCLFYFCLCGWSCLVLDRPCLVLCLVLGCALCWVVPCASSCSVLLFQGFCLVLFGGPLAPEGLVYSWGLMVESQP
ncbi:unnamed protein product, partial [Penicillium nalgiovense]